MPIKSKAQRRKFAELLMKGKISPETFEEWNRGAGSAELPERLHPKRARPKRKGATTKKAVKPRRKAAKPKRTVKSQRTKRPRTSTVRAKTRTARKPRRK